jgi:hypothetical protein
VGNGNRARPTCTSAAAVREAPASASSTCSRAARSVVSSWAASAASARCLSNAALIAAPIDSAQLTQLGVNGSHTAHAAEGQLAAVRADDQVPLLRGRGGGALHALLLRRRLDGDVVRHTLPQVAEVAVQLDLVLAAALVGGGARCGRAQGPLERAGALPDAHEPLRRKQAGGR